MGCHLVAVAQYTFTHKQYAERHKTNNIEEHNNMWECGLCPVLARFTLAFALQLRKKHGKTSVRVFYLLYLMLNHSVYF